MSTNICKQLLATNITTTAPPLITIIIYAKKNKGKTFFGQESEKIVYALCVWFMTLNLALHINNGKKSKSCLVDISTCVCAYKQCIIVNNTCVHPFFRAMHKLKIYYFCFLPPLHIVGVSSKPKTASQLARNIPPTTLPPLLLPLPLPAPLPLWPT